MSIPFLLPWATGAIPGTQVVVALAALAVPAGTVAQIFLPASVFLIYLFIDSNKFMANFDITFFHFLCPFRLDCGGTEETKRPVAFSTQTLEAPKGCTKERVLNSLIPCVGDRPFPYPLPLMHIGLKYLDWLDVYRNKDFICSLGLSSLQSLLATSQCIIVFALSTFANVNAQLIFVNNDGIIYGERFA